MSAAARSLSSTLSGWLDKAAYAASVHYDQPKRKVDHLMVGFLDLCFAGALLDAQRLCCPVSRSQCSGVKYRQTVKVYVVPRVGH